MGPGPVTTEGVDQYDEEMSGSRLIERMPVGRWGRPEEVAWLVAYLLGPAGDWITGSFFPLDGGAQLAGRRFEP